MAKEMAQRQKACKTSSYLKNTNTPKSITTHTNGSPQRAGTQLQLSHQLFVTSAEDEFGDRDGDQRRGGERENGLLEPLWREE